MAVPRLFRLKVTELAAPWPVRLVAVIVFLNGFFAVLEVVTTRLPSRLEAILPFDYDYAKSLGLFAGFVLMYFSSQLYQRKRMAWWIATVGSGLIVLAHTVYARDFSILVLPSISFVLLVSYQDQFRARSETSSIGQGFRLLGLTVLIALVYGVAGFLLLLPRDFHMPFSLSGAVVRTLREYTLIGNSDLVAHSRHARWFLRSLDLLGITGFGFAILSLFRPLAYRYRTLPHDRQKARELLERYGTSSEDFFKLWPEDKSYFFAAGGFIAYKVVGGTAFALGDVTAPSGQRAELLKRFVLHCQDNGWTACWVYVSDATQRLAKTAGLRSIKIGEEAVIDISRFIEITGRNKHFRHVRNKFTKLGYSAEMLEPPHSPELLRQAAVVSRSWLQVPGRVERGFALGYFDRRYLAGTPLFVVRDKKGTIQAFANIIPTFAKGEANFDLMRHRRDSETGVMDFLFMRLIEELSAGGWQRLNMGLAPFSGLDTVTDKSLEEHVIGMLYHSQFKLTNFQGLRRFKEKFDPDWQSRYLAYAGSPAALAKVGVAASRLVQVAPLR